LNDVDAYIMAGKNRASAANIVDEDGTVVVGAPFKVDVAIGVVVVATGKPQGVF
jgi:hypothetical protein